MHSWIRLFLGLAMSPLALSVEANSTEHFDLAADKILESARTLEPDLPEVDVAPVALNRDPLTLLRAVEVALANNPTLQSRREAIRFAAMDLQSARRDFQPRFRANLSLFQSESSYTFGEQRFSESRGTYSQTLSVSQRLPFGGEVVLEGGSVYNTSSEADDEFSPSAALALRLPLMRGFGIDYNTESMVQKRRNLLYSLRSLRLHEEEIALLAIDSYLGVLAQKQRIHYLEQRKNGANLLFRRAETFKALGRESALDHLRAEQEFLRSERDLATAQTDLVARLDGLKVLLFLPVTDPLELAPFSVPQLQEVAAAEDPISAALQHRVELRTLRDGIDDARRRIQFARQDLRPDLDMRLRAATSSSERSRRTALSEDYSAGLNFSLPLDRVRENLSLYDALQDVVQRERDIRVAQEAIAAEVRGAVRNLENNLETLRLQKRIIETVERRSAIAQIQFEAGEVSNREVIEADTSLLAEQNFQVELLQSRFRSILRYHRTLGQFNPRQPLAPFTKK